VFDHVTIRVADRAASERFYGTVLATLGIEPTYSDDGLAEWDDFSLAAAGYRDDGAPRPRPQYRPDYYAAFLLDPDGNNIEAVNHNR
jgi:catechol 2,3-dioxygenase-like lactoylglutathione lyase family enzyme